MNLKVGTKEESINHASTFMPPRIGTSSVSAEAEQIRLQIFGIHALAGLEFAASLFREGFTRMKRVVCESGGVVGASIDTAWLAVEIQALFWLLSDKARFTDSEARP